MRHRKKTNHLSRKTEHYRALMKNLAVALIMHKRIKTTVAKAKALRRYIEPLITRAKEDTTHNRRIVFAYLQNKYAVKELFDEIAHKVGDRPGGYTRVLKLGFRKGDGAEMALIELVDYNETYTQNPKALAEERKRRTRRGGKKKSTATEQATQEVQEQTTEPTQEEASQTTEQTTDSTNQQSAENKEQQ